MRFLGKTRSKLGKIFLHPQKYALPYTYGVDDRDKAAHASRSDVVRIKSNEFCCVQT